jgi:hypothetical protein
MELEDRLDTLVEQKEQLHKEKDDMDAEEVCVSNLDELIKARCLEIWQISKFCSKTCTIRPSDLPTTRLFACPDPGAIARGAMLHSGFSSFRD